MSNEPLFELVIEERGFHYFVVLSGDDETREYGPFETEVAALNMYEMLVSEALEEGWEVDTNASSSIDKIREKCSYTNIINQL